MCRTRPTSDSPNLRTTLPTNPSQTTTSSGPCRGWPAQQVTSLDVADVVNPAVLLEQAVGLLDDRGALLLLLTDVEQPDLGDRSILEVAHVDRAQMGEADQLPGGTIHVRAGIEHQHRAVHRGDQGADGGTLHAVEEPEQHRGGGEHRAGVPGRNERVGLLFGLETEPDDKTAISASGGPPREVVPPCR